MIDLTGYKLTFDDEFNQRSISQNSGTTWSSIRSEWRLDANSDIGFGHSSFVDPASGYDPFKVANGALTITAVPDSTSSGYPGSWESGLITTQGKFSQTYGYFEMRADLSESTGAWDAFWMLPDVALNATPQSWQELDIVEHYGVDPASTYRWIHTTDPSNNINAERQVTTSNPEQASGYHTYGMDWQADRISFYFDGQYMGSQATPSDMHAPMYLLANLATQDNAQGSSMAMSIDYIRAYSDDPNATAITPGSVSAPDGNDPGYYGASVGGGLAATNETSTPASSPAIASPVTPAAVEPVVAAAVENVLQAAVEPATPAAAEPVTAAAAEPVSVAAVEPATVAAEPVTVAAGEPATAAASTEPMISDVSSRPAEAAPTDVSQAALTDTNTDPIVSDPVVSAPSTPVETSERVTATPIMPDVQATTPPGRDIVVDNTDLAGPYFDLPAQVAMPTRGCARHTHADSRSDAAYDFTPGPNDWDHPAHHAHHHDWAI